MIQSAINFMKTFQILSVKDRNQTHLTDLPEEILRYILKHLRVPQLMHCRGVCVRWKETIDNICERDEYWRVACEQEYSNVYKLARFQASTELQNYQLYKSLYLWQDLKIAKASYSTAIQTTFSKIVQFVHASGGCIGATIGGGDIINYYDVETLQVVKTLNVGCPFTHFTENGNMIAYLIDSSVGNPLKKQLRIVPKEYGIPVLENMKQYSNVYSYVLLGEDIFYCIKDLNFYKIYVCKLSQDYRRCFLKDIYTDIFTFGVHLDHLYVVGQPYDEFHFTFYKNNGNDFVIIEVIDSVEFIQELASKLIECGLVAYLERGCSTVDVLLARQYGSIIIIVSDFDGTVKIYDTKAFSADATTDPLAIYNLKENCEIMDFDRFDIVDMAVIERNKAHTIVFFTWYSVLLLNLEH